MKPNLSTSSLLALVLAAGGVTFSSGALALDEAGIQALMKKSDCLKCHAVDKKKDGPMFKETAAKYKKEGGGEGKLFTFLTTSPKIEIDGAKEEHVSLKTKNEAEIKEVIAWILAR